MTSSDEPGERRDDGPETSPGASAPADDTAATHPVPLPGARAITSHGLVFAFDPAAPDGADESRTFRWEPTPEQLAAAGRHAAEAEQAARLAQPAAVLAEYAGFDVSRRVVTAVLRMARRRRCARGLVGLG